jgi:hypothetical protein
MICTMACEADEQFEPQPLSFDQRSVVARFGTIAQAKGVHGFAVTAHSLGTLISVRMPHFCWRHPVKSPLESVSNGGESFN